MPVIRFASVALAGTVTQGDTDKLSELETEAEGLRKLFKKG